MVHHKRTVSQAYHKWAAKSSAGTNNTYDSEFKKAGIRRTYSEETDLSETGKYSSTSSGDESWSSSLPGTPAASKTKLSGEAELFVPQQPMQGPGEQRTRLSSGASVFVPGQNLGAPPQMAPAFTAPMQQSPMFMPQMMPMDQANVMPYMAPCYMAPDGCYYPVGADSVCPVAMPVILGPAPPPPPLPFGLPEVSVEAANECKPLTQLERPSMMKDPQFTGHQKAAANASGKKSWADLNDDDDADDPWLQ